MIEARTAESQKNDFSSFYKAQNRRYNTFGFIFLALHLPVLCIVATFTGHSWLLVGAIMLLLLAGPSVVLLQDLGSALGGVTLAVAAMSTCALAIHVANGMIEAHFEIFLMIALLSVYGRASVLLVAAVTIALQHLAFWVWLPGSIFNYKAPLAIVLLHAFYVVLEVLPACWIAQQFGRSREANAIVATRLSRAAENIASGAEEVFSSSQTLAQDASQQAAFIQETSASAERINSMASRNKASALDAASSIGEAMKQIGEVNQTLSQLLLSMEELNISNQRVGNIIKIIDQIAFQTNILALNATVEAARAGQSGAGFAVVADEVRNLAQRSAQAAKDTSVLIAESMNKSREGAAGLTLFATSIRVVTEQTSMVKNLIDDLRGSSQEQSLGVEQINRAIRQVESVTQSNAATAEETAAASGHLTDESNEISKIVTELLALTNAADR